MNDIYLNRIKEYFDDDYQKYIDKLNEPCTQGFFINTLKGNKSNILDLIDFEYEPCLFSDDSYYHNHTNIGKTKAYELGLIYPQEIAASLTTKYLNTDNIYKVVDMCSAPGGKTINIANRLKNNSLIISNDNSHLRASILSSNLERMGIDNVIVTNKECDELANQLEGFADLVILDAPCSGEGMIRKYPEILDTYNINNINELADLQKNLLESAYKILNNDSYLIYSTCTYAFEEDENQVDNFLKLHPDISLIELKDQYYSKLKGTSKLCPILDTEGQFFAIMHKGGNKASNKINELDTVKDKLVDKFIKDNLNIDKYYLYKNNNHYYLSLFPLANLKRNVLKYGIYCGDVVNNRFEPSHSLYRANSLRNKFKYVYDLNDNEYDTFISGNVINTKLENNYYLITYKGYSLGFGKVSNNQIKNKYPKGLRRMV